MSDYLIFDNIDTRTLNNISVFAGSVDNTPKRVYTPVEIAGRNGVFYIDERRFEDVEQTYSIVALTKEDGSAFINALASKVGYFRLSDSFNTDEFYQATFTSGAEVKIPSTRDKSVFEITFTRKPQRFLTSGETAVSVASGGTITNPTLFDSKPLIEAIGYGTMNIGTSVVKVENIPIGDLVVFDGGHAVSKTMTITIDDTYANSGDSINGVYTECQTSWTISSGSLSNLSVTFIGSGNGNVTHSAIGKTISLNMGNGANAFLYGTPRTDSVTFSVSVTSSQYGTLSGSVVLSIAYNGSNQFIATATVTLPNHFTEGKSYISMDEIILNSTKTSLTTPIYLDMDIGEAYTINNGVVTSMNNIVQLPAELPTLASGANTITYDNTFTSVKIVPRWWRV